MGRFTPIESVIDVEDPNILWNYIPGFNGYEVSYEINQVRSMKHYMEYPFGILIKPRKRSHSGDPAYELSDNNNKRVVVRLSQLIYLARTNPWGVTGYPRRTIISNPCSRNQRVFVCKQSNMPELNSRAEHYPEFTITPDTDDPRLFQGVPMVKAPISDIDGRIYYGRDNYRALYPGDVYRG